MDKENYLLIRARLILTELSDEYVRVQKLCQCGWFVEFEKCLDTIKKKMLEVEKAISVLEIAL